MTHEKKVFGRERFHFDRNSSRFLELLDDARIRKAESSPRRMGDVETLVSRTFLNASSGSGLFGLAVRRRDSLVLSFDFDPRSVACTAELMRRYFRDDLDWTIEEASVLDRDYIAQSEAATSCPVAVIQSTRTRSAMQRRRSTFKYTAKLQPMKAIGPLLNYRNGGA